MSSSDASTPPAAAPAAPPESAAPSQQQQQPQAQQHNHQRKQKQPKQPRSQQQHASDSAAGSQSGSVAAGGKGAASASSSQQQQQSQKPREPRPKQPKPTKHSVSAAAAAASSPSALPSLLSHANFHSSVELVDIGANLLDEMFQGEYRGKKMHPPDLEAVLVRAWEAGCKRIIVTAGCAAEGRKVLALIARLEAAADAQSLTFPRLYSTVGVHPTRTKQWNGSEAHQKQYFDQLLECIMAGLGPADDASAANGHTSEASASASTSATVAAPAAATPAKSSGHPPVPRTSRQVVVAVGECGLDYDRLHFSDRDTQLRHFAKHFDLVERVAVLTADRPGGPLHLPLFLHDRNTRGEFLAILRTNRHRFRHGVVHSFTGTVDDLQALLALDLHIGINGCSLKTEENLSALDHLPPQRLLLETDAPWCEIKATHASFGLVGTRPLVATRPEKWTTTLAGVRGRCEPAGMVQVLEVVAARVGIDALELAAIVLENTKRVFFPHECA